MPKSTETERIYTASLNDVSGLNISKASRLVEHFNSPYFKEISAGDLLREEAFRVGAMPEVFEVILRDTYLPDAPIGNKWMIVVGPSRTYENNQSRFFTIDNGTVSVEHGEQFIGMSIDGALKQPKWGLGDSKHALAYTIAMDVYDDFIIADRKRNKDEMFHAFLVEMNAFMPTKNWYTKEELEIRSIASKEILNVLMYGTEKKALNFEEIQAKYRLENAELMKACSDVPVRSVRP